MSLNGANWSENIRTEAINRLQDHNKITLKRIALHPDMNTKTIRQYMIEEYNELIIKWNNS